MSRRLNPGPPPAAFTSRPGQPSKPPKAVGSPPMAAFPFNREPSPKGERGETLPESNPETPPDSTDPTGTCPRCGQRSSFDVGPSHAVSFNASVQVMSAAAGGATVPEELDRATILLCRHCKQGVVVIEEEWIGDHPAREGIKGGGNVTWRGIHWWPAPGAGDLGDSIPKKLQDTFVEGVRSHGAKAPHAAAVMFRRTVEGIVRDKGNEAAVKQLDNGDLPGALEHMHKASILDKTLYEWTLEIRALGNTGGHFDAFDNVSPEQADALLLAVRQLLRYVYEEPERMRHLRESRGVSGDS